MSKIINPRNLKHATPEQVAAAQRGELAGMPLDVNAALSNHMRMAANLLMVAMKGGQIPDVQTVVRLHMLTGQAMSNIIATQLQMQQNAAQAPAETPKIVTPGSASGKGEPQC